MTSNNFINLKKYKLEKKLGKGTFGQVYIAIEKETSNLYAAKVSLEEVDATKKDSLRNFTREVNIISQISYPSILKFIGFSPIDFQNNNNPVIITEYCPNGSLQDAIQCKLDSKGWNDTKILINIYGIASALAFLHSNEVLHRDLKPQNILLDANLYPKIADFGLSKINSMNNNDTLSGQSTSEMKGTLIYMSPEIIESSKYTPACDVYAFSIIVYQLITKLKPYPNIRTEYNLMNAVTKNRMRPVMPDSIPGVYKKMIEKCWEQSPELRPSFEQIKKDLKTNQDFVTEKVDMEEFNRYIEFVESSEKFYHKDNRIFYSSYYLKTDELENNEEVKSILSQIEDPVENDEDDEDFPNLNDDEQRIALKETSSSNQHKIDEKVKIDELSNENGDDQDSNNGKVRIDELNDKVDEKSTDDLKIDELNNEKVKNDELGTENCDVQDSSNDKVDISDSSNDKVKLGDKANMNSSSSGKELSSQFSKSVYKPNKEVESASSSPFFKQYNSNRIKTISYKNTDRNLYPISELTKLSEECRSLVEDSENDPCIQYQVGRSLIEGTNGFPRRSDIGMKYINQSKEYQCIEAIVYYCSLLIDGVVIPKDVVEAKKILKKYIKGKNSDALLLYAKVLIDENDYSNGIKYLIKASKEANNQAMFELAKIFILGLGGNKDFSKAIEYFEMAKNNGNEKSQRFLDMYNQMKERNGFIVLPPEVQQILITELIDNENENDKIYLKSDSINSILSFGCLDSSNLIEFLSSFEEVFADVVYPSFTFHRVFNILSKILIKKLNDLKVNIIVDSPLTVEHLIAHNSVISSVVLSQSVKQISPNSFNGCPSLKSVEFLTNSVSSIGNYSFYGCSSFVNIEIPSSVKSIGKSSFSKCSSLVRLDLPSISSINDCLLFECFSLKEVKIPPSVTVIEEAAFFGCCSLKKVEIPENVVSIGDNCFNGCSSLVEFSIPSNCKSIGKSVFAGCSSLSKIEILSSIDNFGEGLFSGCKSLRSVKIPDSSNSIEEAVFYGCSSLEKIVIPSSVKSIKEAAFCGCKSLHSINVPPSIELIGVSAFQDCGGLTQFDLPSSVKVIGSYAFDGCKNLKKFVVPNTLKIIGVGAFCRCESLGEITVPKSLADKGEGLGLDKKTKMNVV